MEKNKSILLCLTAVFLAFIMAVQIPLGAFAASRNYISEISLECGDTAEEAKKKLTDAGYSVYDVNLATVTYAGKNDDGSYFYPYMYIGYKTTVNPEEALTDIRVMNMDGGYSETEYRELLKQKKEEIGVLIDSVMAGVDEFRTNFSEKRECALYAYRMLNIMVEDDSGLGMGDWLLDTAKTRDDYIRVFTQCNSTVFLTVAKALAVACAYSDGEGITKIVDLDPEDFAGETQYEETASAIFDGLTTLRIVLEPYTVSDFRAEDEFAKEDLENGFSDMSEEKKVEWATAFPLAAAMNSLEMANGQTLLELVLSDPDELTTEDFYPLASLLSPGQAAIVRFAGLQIILSTSLVDVSKWTSLGELVKIDESLHVSVYAGVDRSLFEGGVALTSKALVEAASSNDNSWFSGNLDSETEKTLYKIIGVSACICMASATLWIGGNMFMDYFGAGVLKIVDSTDYMEAINLMHEYGRMELAEDYLADIALCEQWQLYSLYAVQITEYIGCIALGVVMIMGAVYLAAEGYSYYHPNFSDIPRILVSKAYDEEGNTVFINYYSVKNTQNRPVDFAQFQSRRWVALYTTKDSKAGKPILEDITAINKNYLSGYTGVRKFSEETAYDLSKYAFQRLGERPDGTSLSSIFLFYKQADDSRYSASVFSNPGSIVLAVASFVVGGLAGAAIGISSQKRKHKEDSPKEV